jgi:hypothetical protein
MALEHRDVERPAGGVGDDLRRGEAELPEMAEGAVEPADVLQAALVIARVISPAPNRTR